MRTTTGRSIEEKIEETTEIQRKITECYERLIVIGYAPQGGELFTDAGLQRWLKHPGGHRYSVRWPTRISGRGWHWWRDYANTTLPARVMSLEEELVTGPVLDFCP
jgi:hypothetical protein